MCDVKLVAVTGANGWIGRQVCNYLEIHGYEVRRLMRAGVPVGSVHLDITAPESDPAWGKALNGCRVVVHCAAHVHRLVETMAERVLFEAVNVAGTKKLVAACETAGVSRFVLAGSSAVYDWTVGRAKAEDSPCRAATAYARSKLESENIVRGSSLDWRIARLATVFGEGDTANFWRLAGALKKRRFVIPGRGEARKSVLSAGRAGELLGMLATQEGGRRAVLNLAAPTAPTLREICGAFSRRCGFAAASTAPIWLFRCGARLGDAARALRLPVPLATDTLNKLTTSTVLDVTEMQHVFPDLIWPDFDEDLGRAADYYAAS